MHATADSRTASPKPAKSTAIRWQGDGCQSLLELQQLIHVWPALDQECGTHLIELAKQLAGIA